MSCRPSARHASPSPLAATAYAGLAWRERRPAHLVRAGLALTVPAWMDERGNAKAVSRIPSPWRAEAERWIPAVPELAWGDAGGGGG